MQNSLLLVQLLDYKVFIISIFFHKMNWVFQLFNINRVKIHRQNFTGPSVQLFLCVFAPLAEGNLPSTHPRAAHALSETPVRYIQPSLHELNALCNSCLSSCSLKTRRLISIHSLYNPPYEFTPHLPAHSRTQKYKIFPTVF